MITRCGFVAVIGAPNVFDALASTSETATF